MKKIITLLSILFVLNTNSFSQKIGEEIKQNSKAKTTHTTNEIINESIDGAVEGIKNLFKKKKDKDNASNNKQVDSNHNNQYQTANNQQPTSNIQYDSEITKTDAQGNTDYSAYKNFDFIPAENILFYDDFKDNSKARWGFYDENNINIIHLDGKKWLEVNDGNFFPLGLKILPKEFTLEFDAYIQSNYNGTLDIRFLDKSQAEALSDPYLDNSSLIHLSPKTQMPKTGLGGYEMKKNNDIISPDNEFKFYSWQPELGNYYARISLKRTDNKVSLWVNKEKVLENTDVFIANMDYLLSFHLQTYFVPENKIYITNVRLATGNTHPKNEIQTKKKFVTQNIYFDVNSDVIKPNSYAVLKEIANTIKDIEGQIFIIGHTDSDGADEANLILSQKRAASVKRALVNEFGIDFTKLITDGKGESQPLNQNKTLTEKAQNRRVEFILK